MADPEHLRKIVGLMLVVASRTTDYKPAQLLAVRAEQYLDEAVALGLGVQ